MALCLLQEKGRRESEGPQSCRRSSSRSPTSAEKCVSFESTSPRLEVSGRRAGGPVQESPERRSVGGACWPQTRFLGPWGQGSPHSLGPFRKPVWPLGLWWGEQVAFL